MEDETIVVSYETLFELLRLERSRTELQKLPDSYMEDIKKLIDSELNAIKLLEDESERKKKEIHLKSTLKIVKELYERREKKVVNMALDKSKTKAAIIDFFRLLKHEEEMFGEILSILDKHRGEMDNSVLVKAESKELKEESSGEPSESEELARPEDKKETLVEESGKGDKETEEKVPDIDDTKKTVRFLSSFPRFLGPELEEYGPFGEEDIANLPSEIADILVEKERAEEIIIKD